jgi:hypothetical protein
MKLFFLLGLLVMLSFSGFTIGPQSIGVERLLTEGLYWSITNYGPPWITADQNGDGRIDYAMLLDDQNRRLFEAIDFNHDGYMDDFYIYRNDVLIRREIDQTNNQKIDLWVYLREGVYVAGYERDTTGDGRIDRFRVYGE